MKNDSVITKNSATSYSGWVTLLRIVLGLILLFKGISFFHDSTTLESLMRRKGWDMFDNNAETVAFIITYANLLGGLFIATGLFTRWSAVVQFPILIGAVIFNVQEGLSSSNSELFLSIVTLVLAIIFVFKGSGAISADEFFRNYFMAGGEKGHTQRFFQ